MLAVLDDCMLSCRRTLFIQHECLKVCQAGNTDTQVLSMVSVPAKASITHVLN